MHLPLILIAEEEDFKICSIKDRHLGGKPRSINKFVRKHQSTESKVFSKSTLYITDDIFFLLQNDRNSLATRNDSIIERPLTKAVCLLEIRSRSNGCNLLANTFVMILTEVLITLIGLKSPMKIGCSFFGIRAIVALFRTSRLELCECMLSTREIKSVARIS